MILHLRQWTSLLTFAFTVTMWRKLNSLTHSSTPSYKVVSEVVFPQFVCLFVRLSVSMITQNIVFVGLLAITKSTPLCKLSQFEIAWRFVQARQKVHTTPIAARRYAVVGICIARPMLLCGAGPKISWNSYYTPLSLCPLSLPLLSPTSHYSSPSHAPHLTEVTIPFPFSILSPTLPLPVSSSPPLSVISPPSCPS